MATFDPFTASCGNTTTAIPPVATSAARPCQTAKLGVSTAEMTRRSARLAQWEIRRLMGAPEGLEVKFRRKSTPAPPARQEVPFDPTALVVDFARRAAWHRDSIV